MYTNRMLSTLYLFVVDEYVSRVLFVMAVTSSCNIPGSFAALSSLKCFEFIIFFLNRQEQLEF